MLISLLYFLPSRNLDDQSDKMFVIDLIAALPDVADPVSPA